MNKYKYFLLVMLSIASVIPARVFAEKVMFFTPTRILLDDKNRVEVMNITNLSNITRAYKISFQDQVMTYDGITTSVDNFEYSAKRMLRFVPRDFTLAPGERQTVRIMSRIRPDTQPGDYHTHIRFLEDVSKRRENNPPQANQAASISAPLAYEALIPAIVSHGRVQSTVGLKSANLSSVAGTRDYKVNLILTRSGNGQGIAYVDTQYVAPNGTVTPLTPRRTVYLYREIDERVKDYEFSIGADLPPGGGVKVTLYDNPRSDAVAVDETLLQLP